MLALDGGDQSPEAQGPLVAGDGRLRGDPGGGEAGIGDQVPGGGDDQVGRLRQGMADGVHEIAGQVDGGAEGADMPARHVHRGDAGGGETVAAVHLDEPLQVGAARATLRIGRGAGQLNHLLAAEIQAGGGVVPIEHQPVRPVGAEHHHPVLRREEVEVVVFALQRLAGVGDHLEGRHPERLLPGTHRPSVGEEGAHAVDEIAVRAPVAVEGAGNGPAGAVRLQREIAIEPRCGLGRRQRARAHLHGLGGGAVGGDQVREPVVLVAGTLLDIGAQVVDLPLFELVFEDQEPGDRREGGDGHGHDPDAKQEFPCQGGHG